MNTSRNTFVTSNSNGPILVVEETALIDEQGQLHKGSESLGVINPGEPVILRREIPVAAVASWSELLGIDNPTQVLDAITHVQDHGEPEPDPVTGDNVWTDSFALLAHREQEREREALKAREEGTRDDPRSPLLRSTLAAYNAVHQPIDGGECVMDRCRRAARERLGIDWEPSAKTQASSRLMSRTLTAADGAPGQQEYVNTLEPLWDQIELNRREFLHNLTGNTINPLRDTTPLEVEHTVEEANPFAATLRKYGGAHA